MRWSVSLLWPSPKSSGGRVRNRQVAGFLIVKTEKGMRVDRQTGFDTQTLRVIYRDRYNTWFSDKDHVYMDASGSLFSGDSIVEHADPATFHQDPASSYWMDKNHVFVDGRKRICEEIDGELTCADATTWRRLSNDKGLTRYFVDKDHVWYCGRILKGAAPKTFKLLNDYYSTDGEHVWLRTNRLGHVD
ncbi:MAG: DKNYY domain-containing protein [Pirellulaceae bacterium]